MWQVNNASGAHFMTDSTSNGIAPASPGGLCLDYASRFTFPLPHYLEIC